MAFGELSETSLENHVRVFENIGKNWGERWENSDFHGCHSKLSKIDPHKNRLVSRRLNIATQSFLLMIDSLMEFENSIQAYI